VPNTTTKRNDCFPWKGQFPGSPGEEWFSPRVPEGEAFTEGELCWHANARETGTAAAQCNAFHAERWWKRVCTQKANT